MTPQNFTQNIPVIQNLGKRNLYKAQNGLISPAECNFTSSGVRAQG
jgi:hypothetical protein